MVQIIHFNVVAAWIPESASHPAEFVRVPIALRTVLHRRGRRVSALQSAIQVSPINPSPRCVRRPARPLITARIGDYVGSSTAEEGSASDQNLRRGRGAAMYANRAILCAYSCIGVIWIRSSFARSRPSRSPAPGSASPPPPPTKDWPATWPDSPSINRRLHTGDEFAQNIASE